MDNNEKYKHLIGEVIEVSNNGRDWNKRVLLTFKKDKIFCWCEATTKEEAEDKTEISPWNYWREISDEVHSVTEDFDLVSYERKGDIAFMPKHIIEKMLERQFEQTGKFNIQVFEANAETQKDQGGFDWEHTPEGEGFWSDVIAEYEFDVFYNKYPNKSTKYLQTFDKCLMKTSSGEWWPTFFAFKDEDGDYIDISRNYWEDCVPYEGNEYLINKNFNYGKI